MKLQQSSSICSMSITTLMFPSRNPCPSLPHNPDLLILPPPPDQYHFLFLMTPPQHHWNNPMSSVVTCLHHQSTALMIHWPGGILNVMSIQYYQELLVTISVYLVCRSAFQTLHISHTSYSNFSWCWMNFQSRTDSSITHMQPINTKNNLCHHAIAFMVKCRLSWCNWGGITINFEGKLSRGGWGFRAWSHEWDHEWFQTDTDLVYADPIVFAWLCPHATSLPM